MSMNILCTVLGAALTLLAGCTQVAPPPRTPWPVQPVGDAPPSMNLDAACVADYRPGVDYFPDKLAFSYSTQLTVVYGPHYKRVWFRPSVVAGEVQEYMLVQCGTPTPPHGPHVQVVQVPVQRLVTGNSAMLGALDELGLVDRLFGSESTRSVTVPSVRERVARGLVQDMWGHGHASIEPVIAAQPDVYLSFYSAYPQGNMHPRLWELGVRAIAQADHHETHPLGRAEWLKLLALLGNREALADTQFAHIASEYARWREIASQAGTRPDVLAGFASGRATMETFGGHNQRAQLIHDAGGRYVLDDVESPSSLVYLPFEMVYVRGAQAPVWLGTLGGRASVQSLLEANTLHGWFAAAQAGRVYAWDHGYTGAWAYPYQDQGMTRPHVQLAEAVVALHPELLHLAGAAAPPAPQFLRKLP